MAVAEVAALSASWRFSTFWLMAAAEIRRAPTRAAKMHAILMLPTSDGRRLTRSSCLSSPVRLLMLVTYTCDVLPPESIVHAMLTSASDQT